MSEYRKATRTEKILGVFFTILWIVSWFLACWFFTLQFFFTGLFAFILGWVIDESRKIKPKTSEELNQELTELQNRATKKSIKKLRKHLKKTTRRTNK